MGSSNLPWVDVIPAAGLNVYSILQRDYLILSKDAVDLVVENLRRPIRPWYRQQGAQDEHQQE